MIDLSVRVGGLTLANPVMPASGTFAEGLDKAIDFSRLGAFVTKTITRELRAGNPLPRVVERPGGLINSIIRCHIMRRINRPWWSASRRRPRKTLRISPRN